METTLQRYRVVVLDRSCELSVLFSMLRAEAMESDR
jgi:hypothetical protein